MNSAEGMPQLLLRLPSIAGMPPPPTPPAPMLLRRATGTDAASLAQLLTAAFAEEWTVARVQAELLAADDVLATFVIDQQGPLVATASARSVPHRFPGSGYVHYVGVVPAQQGRQLGREVLQAVLHYMAQQGFADAVLETDDWRIAALRLYLGVGFMPVLRTEQEERRWSAVLQQVHTTANAPPDPITPDSSAIWGSERGDTTSMHPALVFTAPDAVAWQPIVMPPPGPGEVQVRTQFSVISAGTEGWVLHNTFTWAPTPFPCVPGYQRVGEIVALGEGVTQWTVGQQVVATNGQWSGDITPQWGAHVAVANTPQTEIYAIPPGTDPLDAAGLVVAQVGYNAASRAQWQPGDWVVVYGDGLIGQCAAQAARVRGARVLLVGRHPERLALAAAHSADAVINARTEDVVEAARTLMGVPHAVAVLDTVQTVEAQKVYLPLLEYARGQIVYCGFTPGTVWADMALLQQNELTTYFVQGWTRARMEATLALIGAGQMQVRPLITHTFPAAQGAAAYTLIQTKAEPFLGIALDWSTH